MGDIFDDVEKLLATESDEESNMESPTTSSQIGDDAQIFNENELEDIMAEIESLEKDFDSTAPEISNQASELINSETNAMNVEHDELKLDSSKVDKTDLQKVIDNELESIEIANELESLEQVEVKSEDQSTVLAFDKKSSKKNPNIICYEDLLYISQPPTSNEDTSTPTGLKSVSESSYPASTSKSEMSFSANGMMNVNLTFKVGHEEAKLFIDEVKGLVVSMSGVEVCLNEINGCTVTMENGANFTIPLTQKNSSTTKKVA